MPMTLEERASSVRTAADLSALITELRTDLETNADAWQNADLPQFLEAMAAWIQDLDGYYANTGIELSSVPRCKMFADILMGARIYE